MSGSEVEEELEQNLLAERIAEADAAISRVVEKVDGPRCGERRLGEGPSCDRVAGHDGFHAAFTPSATQAWGLLEPRRLP